MKEQVRYLTNEGAFIQDAGLKNADCDNFFIREGIVIIPKNGVIRNGTVI